MWVFGYGSLMWDGWEKEFGGRKYDRATLHDYHRDFNKKSTASRGTREHPCPTLGLVEEEGAECVGSVFEFDDGRREDVLDYLRRREGGSFTFPEKSIEMKDGRVVGAVTPINDTRARTYVGNLSLERRAEMAVSAQGTNGNCVDYINHIHRKLTDLGIEDGYVRQMWEALNNLTK
jgi:cation transport protein ChaC